MNKEEFISKCNAIYALMAVSDMLPESEKSLKSNADALISYFQNQIQIK